MGRNRVMITRPHCRIWLYVGKIYALCPGRDLRLLISVDVRFGLKRGVIEQDLDGIQDFNKLKGFRDVCGSAGVQKRIIGYRTGDDNAGDARILGFYAAY